MNGQLIDLISANVSTEQRLYWTTVDDYFKGNSLVNTDVLSLSFECNGKQIYLKNILFGKLGNCIWWWS
jgi:hypothetical protein